MSNFKSPDDTSITDRQQRLSDLARADGPMLKQLWADFAEVNEVPDHVVLRGPEVGTVMVRGRAGAIGAPFNLGEMTVTRMSVRLPGGDVGHGHVQGRDRDAAKIAALVDAIAEAGGAPEIDRAILTPLRAARADKAITRAAKAAATKVEFFTMVRGEP